MNNKLVFLVYDARSGSTLLAALLNQYKGVSVIPETNYISRMLANEMYQEKQPVEVVLEFLNKEPHFKELSLDEKRFGETLKKSDAKNGIVAVTESLVSTYLVDRVLSADSVVVIKSGQALLSMPEISQLFPEATFLHIVRDGRAVFSSKSKSLSSWNRKFGANIISGAYHWAKRIGMADRFIGKYVEIKYEDLILDQEKTICSVLEGFGLLERSFQLEESVDEYAKKIGGRQKHLHKNIGMPNPTHIDKWRDVLSTNELAYYEHICGDFLESRGYQLFSDDREKIVASGQYRLWLVMKKTSNFYSKLANAAYLMKDGRLLERIKSRV
jgi:sulfotransferase family protein